MLGSAEEGRGGLSPELRATGTPCTCPTPAHTHLVRWGTPGSSQLSTLSSAPPQPRALPTPGGKGEKEVATITLPMAVRLAKKGSFTHIFLKGQAAQRICSVQRHQQAQKHPKLAPEIRCDPTAWPQGMGLACAVTSLGRDQPLRAILNNKTFVIMFAVLGAWQSRDEARDTHVPSCSHSVRTAQRGKV